ncbi:Tor [Penicillium digitatum]|nr:Tor [Penicillium digitatum]
MGGDLNLKKSWHPGLIKNQERVWLEEKRALDERKQIAQLQREREEERQMEEIQRLQEAAGKTKQHRRVDWMYQAPSTETGHYSEEMEGYLLGKRRIDGVLLKNDPDTKKLGKGSEVVGNGAAAGPSIVSARDTMSKVMADPLLEVKKREQAAYEAMVKETLRRKEREKERRDRDRGKDRDRRHRTHDSKRRRYNDDASDDRHHRRSSPRRHRSRSPGSPDRSSRRHRSDRDRDDEYRPDNRDRRSDEHRSRRDNRDRGGDRRDYHEKKDRNSFSSRHQDREDRGGRDRSPTRNSRSPLPSSDRKERPTADEDRRRKFPRREYNNWRDSDRAMGPPSTRTPTNKPDPKELEEERRRKLAEMQNNATEIESERRQRIEEISAKEEEQREADDRLRSDRGRFMSDVNKRVQQDTLDERIRRSRGGLAKMDED